MPCLRPSEPPWASLDRYCACTATLVPPRTAPPASRKRTKIRLTAGSNGIGVEVLGNTANVGVALLAMGTVRLVTRGLVQTLVWGSVWHTNSVMGRVARPVCAPTGPSG